MRKLVIPLLLGGALAVLIFNSQFSSPPTSTKPGKQPKRRFVVPVVRTPDIRLVMPPPVRRQLPIKIRHPFVLPLKARDAMMKKWFAEATKVKVGIREKLFDKVLRRERAYEAGRRGFSQQALRLAAMRYLRYRNMRLYRLYGYKMLARFESLLEAYLRLGGSPLEIPNDSKKGLYTLGRKMGEVAGFYPLLLGQIGLTKAFKGQTLSDEQRFWLRTLMMARWARQVWGFRPLRFLMGQEVYKDYLRARVVWTSNETKRILAYKELLELEPKFPRFRVLGWMLLSMDKKEKAREMLQKAVKTNPRDTIAKILLQSLKK